MLQNRRRRVSQAGHTDTSAQPCEHGPVLPDLDDILGRLHVVALPMRVRFRGITTRELALIDGPAGWGEFGAFVEYDDAEASAWLASAIESAYRPPPATRRAGQTR